jgi:hypothetical protein
MTRSTEPRSLTDVEREALRALADALIPGGAGLPSASQADVQGKWIDRTLAARPDLVAFVSVAVERAGDPAAELERLRTADPATFDGFTVAVCAAYFMNPRVRRLLGYPGTAPKRKPAYQDEADFYLNGGQLLAPVLERGALYRSIPEGPA